VSNKELNELRGKCVAMWEWMSEQKDETHKSDYFRKHSIDNIPEEGCYACEADELVGGGDADCSDCPIDWGDSGECYGYRSPYDAWDSRKTTDNAIDFLKYIKDNWEILPE
jgi:hypothetical protein